MLGDSGSSCSRSGTAPVLPQESSELQPPCKGSLHRCKRPSPLRQAWCRCIEGLVAVSGVFLAFEDAAGSHAPRGAGAHVRVTGIPSLNKYLASGRRRRSGNAAEPPAMPQPPVMLPGPFPGTRQPGGRAMPGQNEPGAGGHGIAPTRFAKAEFFSAKTLVILTTLRGPGCFFWGAMSQGGSGGGTRRPRGSGFGCCSGFCPRFSLQLLGFVPSLWEPLLPGDLPFHRGRSHAVDGFARFPPAGVKSLGIWMEIWP